MINRSSSSSKRVVWDEDNLQHNAQIQQEFSAVKIQEPKTPYRPPLPSDSMSELSDDMKPLQLDEVADALRQERQTAFDYVMSNGGAAFEGSSSQQQQLAATTSNASSEADGLMQDAVGDKRNEPCTSFTSSGSEGSADKRRRFQQMRKQHYNMKDALLKARQLLASEDEEDADPDELEHELHPEGLDGDDDEHEDEEADTAGNSLGNGTAGASSSSQQQQRRQEPGAAGTTQLTANAGGLQQPRRVRVHEGQPQQQHEA